MAYGAWRRRKNKNSKNHNKNCFNLFYTRIIMSLIFYVLECIQITKWEIYNDQYLRIFFVIARHWRWRIIFFFFFFLSSSLGCLLGCGNGTWRGGRLATDNTWRTWLRCGRAWLLLSFLLSLPWRARLRLLTWTFTAQINSNTWSRSLTNSLKIIK